MSKLHRLLVALLVALPLLLACLDWASGPAESRNPADDPNDFFGSHQFLSAIIAETFLIALAYLLVDYLVERSLNRRWLEAADAPLAEYLLQAWNFWANATLTLSRLEDEYGEEDGGLTIFSEIEAVRKSLQFRRDAMAKGQAALEESLTFLVPILGASATLVPVLRVLEIQQRRIRRLNRSFAALDSLGFSESAQSVASWRKDIAAFGAVLRVLDQPLSSLLKDRDLQTILGTRHRLGNAIPHYPDVPELPTLT